jgi:hypothetical protein
MPEQDRRLRALDRIEAPDVWDRARSHHPRLPDHELERPARGRRVAAGVVAFATFAGAVAIGLGNLGGAPVRAPAGGSSPGAGGSPAPVTPTGTPSGRPSPTPFVAIVVETPVPGDVVSSPVTIAGTADVYEGTVIVEILDASGERLARTFTTATCGNGCRGTFSVDVRFAVTDTQPGTVLVYDDAEGGDPLHAVRIPVTLVPAG